MPFQRKYSITQDYLTLGSKKRSGQKITPAVKFVVAHDIGNSGSSALGNVQYYHQTEQTDFAAAHLFVDDKQIIECIPAIAATPPEKAFHVRYDVPADNALFGFDANDTAIGVEYCFGANIVAEEAYKRYVWLIAYLCYTYGIDPTNKITVTSSCISVTSVSPLSN